MWFLAKFYSAEEADKMGLVNKVVPVSCLVPRFMLWMAIFSLNRSAWLQRRIEDGWLDWIWLNFNVWYSWKNWRKKLLCGVAKFWGIAPWQFDSASRPWMLLKMVMPGFRWYNVPHNSFRPRALNDYSGWHWCNCWFLFIYFFFCRNLRGMQPCCFIIQKKDKKERQPS